jgi:hypothetical protein
VGLIATWIVTVMGGLPLSLYAAESISDNQRGFTLTLPEGFTPVQDPGALMPRVVYGYLYGETHEGSINTVLLVLDNGEPLPHRRMQRSELGPAFRGQLLRTTWQGLEIPMTEISEELNGQKATTYSALIPLKQQCIQLKLVGPSDREPELRVLMSQILSGLRGPSNWPSSPPTPATRQPGGIKIIIVFTLLFLVGMVGLWLISRIAPRGTVLVMGVVLFLGGNGARGQNGPVESLFIGLAQMIGFGGILVGLMDLRRRRSQPKAEEGRAMDLPPSDGPADEARS